MQELKPEDLPIRIAFAERQLELIEQDPGYPYRIIMSDEAIFSCHGGVNLHNFRYWSPQNPHWHAEEPLHSPQVTVWMGVGARGIIGPFFFNGVTVNGERYSNMLDDDLLPVVEEFDGFDEDLIQQDGATPHFSGLEWLDENFAERWMGRGTRRHPAPIPWPARSPDLTWIDFFWWGYLKQRLYTDRPYVNVEELMAAIEREVQAVPQEVIESAVRDYTRRLHLCIERGGHSVETY